MYLELTACHTVTYPFLFYLAYLVLSVSVCHTVLCGFAYPRAASAAVLVLYHYAVPCVFAHTHKDAVLLCCSGTLQGSTSVVWQQQSFWNRRPASSHSVLPLFIEPGLVATAVAPLAITAK